MTIISIEGIDGVGKTTLTQDLAHTLSSRLIPLPARPPAVYRYPEETVARALAFATDMACAWELLVRPHHAKGRLVLLDRGPLSTLVYQAPLLGSGQALTVADVAVDGVWPDLTVVLDVPAAVAVARQAARGAVEDEEGRLEGLRRRYREAAAEAPGPVVFVDADASWDVVRGRVLDLIHETVANVSLPGTSVS